jgi:predicted lysophospholipase L1 biosynthesis ABC-type transport system permease subunit
LQAVAMDDAQHRAVVVAQYDRADSTSSAMIETLGAERQMVIVAHDMSWLTMCRIGMVMFEGWGG